MTGTSDHRFAGIFAAVIFELASASSVAASAASSPRPPTPYVVRPGGTLTALTTTDVTQFGLLEGVTLAAIGALVIGLVAVIAIEIERSNLGYLADGRISEALTHALETDNFSEEWVQDAVAVRGDDILADARKIEQQEAWRRAQAQAKEAEYREIADYAASRRGLNREVVLRALRASDELQYRLLEEAKRRKDKRSKGG